MSDLDLVNTRVEGRSGIIELNRPRALNSLTHDMVRSINDVLVEWENDDSIGVVVIRSTSERAFCAGGDVRGVRDTDVAGDFAAGDDFFRDEYEMNLRLDNYNKPIVSLLEGMVMGGGFGLSAHGSHRVITPRTLGAMPEAAIGFVPDVGMSHVLTHLPVDPAMGVFVGCTGWRMSPADLLFLGIGNVLVADVSDFADKLRDRGIPQAIEELSVEPEEAGLARSELHTHHDWIVETFSAQTWEEIQARLDFYDVDSAADANEAQFVQKVREALAPANPGSLVATVELFHRSAQTDMETALKNEFAVGKKLRREPNFSEGVRAVLVDKDRSPKFQPDTAAEVDAETYRGKLV